MNKIEIITTKGYPICPYCEEELKVINKRIEFEHAFGSGLYIYSCPKCKKLLSIAKD